MPPSKGLDTLNEQGAVPTPPLPVLASSFLLAGLGTVVLGPLLPALLYEWHLTDQRGGLLLFAKFVGAFVGGASIPTRLRIGVLAGHLIAALGFAAFAFSPGLGIALPALFLTGLGLGEMIASTNILAGRRWSEHAGSALALLNFFWSLGAVSTGLLVAYLVPRYGWRYPLLGLSLLLAVSGTAYWARTNDSQKAEANKMATPLPKDIEGAVPVSSRVATTYGGLLFLYGGLETCLTGWLTTFSLRFAGGHLLGGQSGFVVLWIALTAGRVLASALMRRFSERVVQVGSLILCLALITSLSQASSAAQLSISCVLLGLALAPVFPSTFALLLFHRPAPRTAGTLLAVSGLGAALFPWLMGVISTHSGSLKLAMAVPALLIPAMLLLTRLDATEKATFPPSVTG